VTITDANFASTKVLSIPHNMAVNLRNAAVTTDSSSNIYVTASENSIVFYKFDSAVNLVKAKLLKSTGVAGKMYANSITIYKDTSIFMVYGGKWITSTDKDSIAVLRANTAFDFAGYTCGLLPQDFYSWDANWVSPSAPSVTANTAAVTVPGTTTTTVDGVNYYMSNWNLMTPAHSVSL
jgi:hypothetical protein